MKKDIESQFLNNLLKYGLNLFLIFLLSGVLGCVNGGLVPGFRYVISTWRGQCSFLMLYFREDIESRSAWRNDRVGRWSRDHIPQGLLKETEHLPWGRNVLLTYISKGTSSRSSRSCSAFLLTKRASRAGDARRTILAQRRILQWPGLSQEVMAAGGI